MFGFDFFWGGGGRGFLCVALALLELALVDQDGL